MTRAPTTYTVNCPAGMLAAGRTCKTFSSVDAFDGYVGALRRLGLVVCFTSPAVATVSRGSL